MEKSTSGYEALDYPDEPSSGDDFPLGSDSHVNNKTRSEYRATAHQRGLLLFISVAVVVVIGCGLLYTLQALSPVAPEERASLIGVCSNNPEKSRDKGCVFDPMMYNWVQEPCYKRDLSDKYFAAGNWTFFADAKGTQPISESAIRQGDAITVWVTGDFHYSHCAYILHKRLVAEEPGSIAMDTKSRPIAHTEHCFKWLSKPKPQVFDLVTLNFSREALGCVQGRLGVDCYSPEHAEICWPGQNHSTAHHAIEK
ncbi:hypothetical protein CDEST_07798 [Colletotrichum destructivum]|uniref:Major facilitator superfamily transporter n=1 Tax=Colletotrichum destructivum TaxID=34406 RepID=A0AAX4IHP1_9PEZI|nr:hypothetical protein CDEST_07798 [Colletotrichum destructivum]